MQSKANSKTKREQGCALWSVVPVDVWLCVGPHNPTRSSADPRPNPASRTTAGMTLHHNLITVGGPAARGDADPAYTLNAASAVSSRTAPAAARLGLP